MADAPTYHQPTDTVASIDMGFMTKAVQSMIEPVRWLADGDFKPQWTATGRH